MRERTLSGEAPAWYVYRDGAWRPPSDGPWWEAPGTPRVIVSSDGWITAANPGAMSLLGLEDHDVGVRHVTDFVAPGALDDAIGLFRLVDDGHDLAATILLRPASGEAIAVDIRAARDDAGVVGHLRLAADVDVPFANPVAESPVLVCRPAGDAAFRGYAELALARMPEPSMEGLAIRLRRLYPHARVEADRDRWVASRDAPGHRAADDAWWRDPALPRVRYDAQALILEANEAATEWIGRPMVGHHWQEFVTSGTSEQVSAMLTILAEVGSAESRFRMPGRDGALAEFDSYTEVDGETYTTVIRPIAGGVGPSDTVRGDPPTEPRS